MSELSAAVRAAGFVLPRRTQKVGKRTRRPSADHRARRRNLAVAVPLILVNGTAVIGQVGWASDHLGRPGWPLAANLTIAALFAATVESIAVFLAYEAHSALMARDPALRLRLSSYAMAAVVGLLNYSHYASGWHPTTRAITFGLLSTLSPWLWAIRSRSANRDALRRAELIDRRSARFAAVKWIFFPVRTWRAFRLAVDCGETRERSAWEASRPAPIVVPPAAQWVVYRPDPAGISPADPVSMTVVAGSRVVEIPAGQIPSRDPDPVSIPLESSRPSVPAQPSRSSRSTVSIPWASRSGTGTGVYDQTLTVLRKRFPARLPTVEEVQAADGRSRSRAGRIRQRLADERADVNA